MMFAREMMQKWAVLVKSPLQNLSDKAISHTLLALLREKGLRMRLPFLGDLPGTLEHPYQGLSDAELTAAIAMYERENESRKPLVQQMWWLQ